MVFDVSEEEDVSIFRVKKSPKTPWPNDRVSPLRNCCNFVTIERAFYHTRIENSSTLLS
jgi:hypothetical protein